LLSKKIDESKSFSLLSATRLNVVCFTINLDEYNVTLENIQQYKNNIINGNNEIIINQQKLISR